MLKGFCDPLYGATPFERIQFSCHGSLPANFSSILVTAHSNLGSWFKTDSFTSVIYFDELVQTAIIFICSILRHYGVSKTFSMSILHSFPLMLFYIQFFLAVRGGSSGAGLKGGWSHKWFQGWLSFLGYISFSNLLIFFSLMNMLSLEIFGSIYSGVPQYGLPCCRYFWWLESKSFKKNKTEQVFCVLLFLM